MLSFSTGTAISTESTNSFSFDLSGQKNLLYVVRKCNLELGKRQLTPSPKVDGLFPLGLPIIFPKPLPHL
jgi:hypothetical protein